MLTIYRPTLYPLQERILRKASGYRFTVLLCGRRFGKTSLILYMLTQAAQGKKIYLFAPSPSSYSETWKSLVELVGAAGKVDNVRCLLSFTNGGLVKMTSLHNIGQRDAERGKFMDIAIYEETQSIDSEILEYHWENVVRATLMDNKGRAFFIGTPPNSKNHYFARLYCIGALNNPNAQGADVPFDLHNVKPNPLFLSIRKTPYDNPYIDNAEIDLVREELPAKVFEQEYLAKFVDYNLSPFVLCFDDEGTTERRMFIPTTPDSTLPFYIAFDFNLNPMAATIWQKNAANSFIQCVAEFGAPKGEKVSIHYTTDKIREWFMRLYGIDIANGALPYWLNIYITGDATGAQKDPRARKGMTFYESIAEELGVTRWGRKNVFVVPSANITHKDSWAQINGWLHGCKGIHVDTNCQNLRQDLKLTVDDGEHGIDKKRHDPHYFDTMRYFFANFLPRVYKQGR